jgi:hypothetical protein
MNALGASAQGKISVVDMAKVVKEHGENVVFRKEKFYV